MRGTVLLILGAALVSAVALVAAPARAAPITFAFEGTVDNVDSDLASVFAVGQTLTGSYTFESTTPPRGGSDSNFAVFDALTALDFAVNGYTGSSSAPQEIQVDNDPGGTDHDRYGLTSRAGDGLTGASVNGFALGGFSFRLDDSTDTVFTDALILPLTLDFADFDSSAFFLFFVNQEDELRIVSGTLSAIGVAQVPEPASIALLGAGLAGLGLVRRRRAGQ